jgi:pyruvate carboxylase
MQCIPDMDSSQRMPTSHKPLSMQALSGLAHHPAAISALGDKVSARRIAAAAGAPLVAGTKDPVKMQMKSSPLLANMDYLWQLKRLLVVAVAGSRSLAHNEGNS